MIDFMPAVSTYEKDDATKLVWSWVNSLLGNIEGVVYYKHPVITTTTGIAPELTILTRIYEPVVIRCLPYVLEEIQYVSEDGWQVNDISIEPPVLELDDLRIALKSKFDKDRVLRNRLSPKQVLALPMISQSDFEDAFGDALWEIAVIWSNKNITQIFHQLDESLSDIEWRHVRSIVQGVSPLKNSASPSSREAHTLGEAVRLLDRQIALLDREQEKAALQIAPGPQRIRGLAGTGKTVLLAMKAANIHRRFPNKKLLFTFNTQSLYNQAVNLISKFYRFYADDEPNWEMLHIRHAWGGVSKPGVYYDLCSRSGATPLTLNSARVRNSKDPFQACCIHALQLVLNPEYDFICIDEAQDFPKEFFQIIYKISYIPYQIYWAYDELQSLRAQEIPRPEDLFGTDNQGIPLVSLDGEPYPSDIEKDLVLHRSYRCPQSILMLAHAIGLGLYNISGCVQMLENKASWEAIGYEVESGELKKDMEVTIYRSPDNSPNPIAEVYKGEQEVVKTMAFADHNDEFKWIAESIYYDINRENIPPEQIIVICLDSLKMKTYLPMIQSLLFDKGIDATIPGLIDGSAAFGVPGNVTLATVFRAKGNEALVVYICSFESLYDYIEAIEFRNRAFTSISRSKAWVRISGTGEKMKRAQDEINKTLKDQPRFRFKFPDMEQIRRLDAVTDKRRRAMRKATNSAVDLLKIDSQVLAALAENDPHLLEELVKKLEEAKRRGQG